MKKMFDILKGKTCVSVLAIVSLLGGVLFLEGSFTGSVVLDDVVFNPISFFGAGLLVCFVILAVYVIGKR